MIKSLLEICDLGNDGSRKAQFAAGGIILCIIFKEIALPISIITVGFIFGRAYCDGKQ